MDKSRLKRNRMRRMFYFLMILFYIPSLVLWLYSDKIKTGLLYNGEINNTLNAEFLLIKNEKVCKSSEDGNLYRMAKDGEKYGKNTTIAYIIDKNNAALIDEKKNIEKRILDKQYENLKNSRIDSSMLLPNLYKEQNLILSVSRYFDKDREISDIGKITLDLNQNIHEKIEIINKLSPPDETQKELYTELKALEKQILMNSTDFILENAGIISYTFDGLEEKLSKDSSEKISLEELKNIKKDYKGYKPASDDIKQGDPVYKTMLSNRVFYVFYISDKYYDIFKDKKRVKIDFRDKGIIDAEIYNITKKDDIKEIVVMLSSYYYIDGIENIRFIDGELIINNTKGIKVDRKSLFEVDDNMETAGIYLAKANYTKHVKVNIVAYDKNFAIIDSFDEKNKIELYDTYIINPKNIKDGQQITN
jgi:hypothetical protein